MILNGITNESLSTKTAALFRSSKTYYYAGFNGGEIQKCKMDEKEKEKTPDTPMTERPNIPTSLSCENSSSSTPASELIDSDDQKINSMTLLVTGLRILLAKCVAVNVLMTVKAFLF